jgi:hypothetical protein
LSPALCGQTCRWTGVLTNPCDAIVTKCTNEPRAHMVYSRSSTFPQRTPSFPGVDAFRENENNVPAIPGSSPRPPARKRTNRTDIEKPTTLPASTPT